MVFFNSKKNQSFYKFVENKKLVIVSPSPVDKKDGVEIDSADIVVRTRYSAKYSVDDLAIKGSRCDITYIFSDSKYIDKNITYTLSAYNGATVPPLTARLT